MIPISGENKMEGTCKKRANGQPNTAVCTCFQSLLTLYVSAYGLASYPPRSWNTVLPERRREALDNICILGHYHLISSTVVVCNEHRTVDIAFKKGSTTRSTRAYTACYCMHRSERAPGESGAKHHRSSHLSGTEPMEGAGCSARGKS